MAKSIKIQPITELFIRYYNDFTDRKTMVSNKLLASIIGTSAQGVSEILGRRQNIQPDQWERFKNHFGITNTEKSESDDRIEDLKMTISDLREDKKWLQRIMETSLAKIFDEQLKSRAYQLAVVQVTAEKGNYTSEVEKVGKISRDVYERLKERDSIEQDIQGKG